MSEPRGPSMDLGEMECIAGEVFTSDTMSDYFDELRIVIEDAELEAYKEGQRASTPFVVGRLVVTVLLKPR